MKKSRIAKLALLGASTAALAATLTTSTYAWYVSNKQADVKGGTGTTGAAGSDGSVLVSWTGADGEWFKEINFADDADAIKRELSPIHFDSDGFYGINANGTKASAAYVTTPSGATIPAIRFDVYVKTGDGVNVTPSITITTTKQASNIGQVAFVDDNTYTRAKAFVANVDYYAMSESYVTPETAPTSSTFVAGTYYTRINTATSGDPVYVYEVAMAFDSTATYYVKQVSYTKDTTVTSANFASKELYLKYDDTLPSVSKGQTFTVDAKKALWVQQVVDGGATTYFAADTTSLADGNAHAYYSAVTGYTPWALETEISGLGVIPTTENVGKKVTYTIYLDGADTDCYNSCAGWDIAFNLQFTISE